MPTKDKSKNKNYLWYKWREHHTQKVQKVPITQEVLERLKKKKETKSIKIWKRDPGVLGNYAMSDDDLTDGSEYLENALAGRFGDTKTKEGEKDKVSETKTSMATKKKKKPVNDSSKQKCKNFSSSDEDSDFDGFTSDRLTDSHQTTENSILLPKKVREKDMYLVKRKKSPSASATGSLAEPITAITNEPTKEAEKGYDNDETFMKIDTESEEDSGLLSAIAPKKDSWFRKSEKSKTASATTSKATEEADLAEKGHKEKSKQLSKQELRRVNQLLSKKYTNERKNFQEVVDQIRSEGPVDTDSESDTSKQLHYRWLYKNLKPNKATEPQSVECTKRMKRWLKHTKNDKEGRFFYSDSTRAAIEDIPSDQIYVEQKTQPLSEEDALERWKLCNSQLKTREWFQIKLMELADKDKSKNKNYLWYKWREHHTQKVQKVPITQEVLERLKKKKETKSIKIWKRDPGVLGNYAMSDDDLTDGSEYLENALAGRFGDTKTKEGEKDKVSETKTCMATKKKRKKKPVKDSLEQKRKNFSSSDEDSEFDVFTSKENSSASLGAQTRKHEEYGLSNMSMAAKKEKKPIKSKKKIRTKLSSSEENTETEDYFASNYSDEHEFGKVSTFSPIKSPQRNILSSEKEKSLSSAAKDNITVTTSNLLEADDHEEECHDDNETSMEIGVVCQEDSLLPPIKGRIKDIHFPTFDEETEPLDDLDDWLLNSKEIPKESPLFFVPTHTEKDIESDEQSMAFAESQISQTPLFLMPNQGETGTHSMTSTHLWSDSNEDQKGSSQEMNQYESLKEVEQTECNIIDEPDLPHDYQIQDAYTHFRENPLATGRKMRVCKSSQNRYGLDPICTESVYYLTRGYFIRQNRRNSEQWFKEEEESEEEVEEKKEKEKKVSTKGRGRGRGGPKKKKH